MILYLSKRWRIYQDESVFPGRCWIEETIPDGVDRKYLRSAMKYDFRTKELFIAYKVPESIAKKFMIYCRSFDES